MSVARSKGTAQSDSANVQSPNRADRYLGAYTSPVTSKELFSCDEGSYFVAITPTPGTGIIGHAAPTTFDEAKPYITVYNSGANRIYPQFLYLHETVASVGGARLQFTVTLDTGNRYSSAGTAMVVNNTNMDSTTASGAVAYIGAVVGTAATATRRIVGNYVFRGTIDIIEDDYYLIWGATSANGGSTSRVATVAEASRILPPMCIGPGQTMLITEWRGSQSTGPTFEAVFGFIER